MRPLSNVTSETKGALEQLVRHLREHVLGTGRMPTGPDAVAFAIAILATSDHPSALVVHGPFAVIDVVATGVLHDFTLDLDFAAGVPFLDQLRVIRRRGLLDGGSRDRLNRNRLRAPLG